MNPSQPPIQTSPKPSSSPNSKRRGRPRSPVFAYFRRLIDEKGEFIGNECTFCTFISKDRSENPTYLTRHILRTCTAPQHVKDAIGVRHPSIAVSHYNPSQRYHPPKQQSTSQYPSPPHHSPANGRRPSPKQKPRSHPIPLSTAMPSSSPHLPLQSHMNVSTIANPSSMSVSTVPISIGPPNSVSPAKPPSGGKKGRPTGSKTLKPDLMGTIPAAPVVGTVGIMSHTYSHSTGVPPMPSGYVLPSVIVQGASASAAPAIGGVSSPGVAKSRRGRPRSPALVHFKRHTDDKGNFIANQCCFCPFVSRDRSENSTLLLRHLLSSGCSCPENMRVVLRGSKYTLDGKRLKKEGKVEGRGKRSSVGGKRPSVGEAEDLKGASDAKLGVPMVQGYAVSPGNVSTALVRFFRRYGIDMDAVQSPLFQEMVQAICTTGSPNGVAGHSALGQDGGKFTKIVPSREELEVFWKNTPQAQLIKADPVALGGFSRANNLVIYFPYTVEPLALRRSTNAYQETNGVSSENVNPAFVASVFRWTSGLQLKYLGSKNCLGDLQTGLSAIVEEAQEEHGAQKKTRFDQLFIARPFVNVDKIRDIPRNDPANVWIPDVAREVEILCQELLAEVPFLLRCMRRNKLVASFFREKYSEGAAVVLFGRNAAEKERCNRYLQHISRSVRNPRCRDALETAMLTYEVLVQTQASHENPQRLQDTGSFLHTISEENSGNVHLCQEVTRLVLSPQYMNELKVFISKMTPLANLICLYSPPRQHERKDKHLSPASQISEAVFGEDHPFRNRSIAQMLPDCLRTLGELYADNMPEFENDLRVLRGHTTRRLLGKGADGVPPIVDDICYVAAFLNPNEDFCSLKGITVEEAWRRAFAFLQRYYGSCPDFSLERALEQLQSFHRRHGMFSSPELFSDVTGIEDPKQWWLKHGNIAPDLFELAMKILSAPTSAFPVVQYIAEMNGHEGLDFASKDLGLMEKERMVRWNLRLQECRLVASRMVPV